MPYVALGHIPNGGGRLLGVDVAGSATSHKTCFSAGDTLFGKLRPNLRKVVQARFDGVCSTDILAIAAKTGTDAAYLYQLLASDVVHRHVMGDITGTKMPRTSWKRLADLSVPCPPLPEQRAIAAVLDAVDETIEHTEEVIVATDELRRTLLHDLLTRGVPGWHTEWKHVPSLGTVPACWEVTTLGKLGLSGEPAVMTGPFGVQLPATDYVDSGVPLLTIGSVQSSGVDETRLLFVADETARRLGRYRVKTDDILFSRVATVGRVARITPEHDGALISYNLMRVRLDPTRLLPGLLTEMIDVLPGVRDAILGVSSGGARQVVNTANLSGLRIPVAPTLEQELLLRVAETLRDKLRTNRATAQSLRSTKVAVADLLLSGRVHVASTLEAAT